MKRLSVALLSVSLFAACGSPVRSTSVLALTGSAANGKTVYSSMCASCHGVDGKGGTTRKADGGVGEVYPSLVEKAASLKSDVFLNDVINGVPGTSMVSYSSLTDQQLADVYAYVKTL